MSDSSSTRSSARSTPRCTPRACWRRTSDGSTSRRRSLHAAQVVTSELEIEAVLERLVQEVTKLLNADAADCHLVDAERGVLAVRRGPRIRRRARSSDRSSLRPKGFPALRSRAPPTTGSRAHSSRRWSGRARRAASSVSGCATRHAPSRRRDVELLEAFASLASLALRNAESFGERSRQARVQRGFYRIASLLGEPLSLAETYDAAAQAAAEALGGEFSAALVRSPAGLGLVGGHALPEAVRSLELPRALDAAALEGHLLAASRISDDERFDERWRDAPFAALLAIPVGGETPGLVLVFFVEERDFARDDLELAHQVAAAATGALDRSRLFEAERSARSLSQQLARTGSLLATELDPAAVLEAVVGEAVNLLDADAAALAALEGEDLVIIAATGTGRSRHSARDRRRPVGSPATWRSPERRLPTRTRLRTKGLPSRTFCSRSATAPISECRSRGGRVLWSEFSPSTPCSRASGGRTRLRRLRHSARTVPSRCRMPSSTSMSRSNVSRASRSSRTSRTASLPSIAKGTSSSGTAQPRRSRACLRQRRSVARRLRCCNGTSGRSTPARAASSQS